MVSSSLFCFGKTLKLQRSIEFGTKIFFLLCANTNVSWFTMGQNRDPCLWDVPSIAGTIVTFVPP